MFERGETSKTRARRNWYRTTPLIAGILAAFSAVAFIPFGRIDYDRHHDGWMLEAAVSVHEGLTLHADVFYHFGQVGPIVHSAFLYLPISPALAVRYATILAITGTVFLLADIGRRKPTASPITQAAGTLAAVAWVILSDVWGIGPMRPWPVFFLIFLLVLSAYLVSRAWLCAEQERLRHTRLLLFCAGLAMGIALFARVASGLVILAALAVCAVAATAVRSPKVRLAGWILPGLLAGLGLIVIPLVLNGSSLEFYHDTLVWPFEYFKPSLLDPVRFFGQLAPVYLPPVVLGVIGLVLLRRSALSSGKRAFASMVIGFVILGTTLLLAPLAKTAAAVPEYFGAGRGLLLFLMCVLVSLLIVLPWSLVKVVQTRSGSPTHLAWFVMSIFALVGIFEIPPDYTLRHCWWSLPLGLVLIFAAIPKLSRSWRSVDNPLLVPLASIAAYSVFVGFMTLSIPRVYAPPDSVAAGMLVSRVIRDEITSDLELLEQYVNHGEAIYLVETGDLAILQGEYSSADPFYACWGYSLPLDERVALASKIVVERESSYCPRIKDKQLDDWGFEELAGNSRLAIYGKR